MVTVHLKRNLLRLKTSCSRYFTLEGYITDIDITAANVDDRLILWEMFQSPYQPIVLGDKGYIGDELLKI